MGNGEVSPLPICKSLHPGNGSKALGSHIVQESKPSNTQVANILHRDTFLFFLQEEEFVSKTINEGSVDLDKFPSSKVHQLAKKYESSKATARHIKQLAGEMQATQIHLMRHQHTELSNGKYKKQKPQAKPRPIQNKNSEQKQSSYHKKSFDPRNSHKKKDRCRGFYMPCQKIPVQELS